ncbi:MAG: glycoside hydrolase family 3 N-terminal domain-containing protein, partial [Microcystaceae cyanobacterium]
DVNNNPNNPVINIRAFGENPETVSRLVQAFIEGAKKYPVLTTAKHFPGHGDTDTDSHLHLPIIPHDLARLETIELPPFQAAIASGVDAVMTAHLLVKVWDRENAATLSPAILTGQLREKLSFTGLIVTDALIMGGVATSASPEEVAIRALEAGADILLMPPDPEKAIAAIEVALVSGRLTEARIEQSLQKIEQAKAKLSLFSPVKNAPQITDLASTNAREIVQEIIIQSLQGEGQITVGKRNLIIVDDLLNCDYLDRASPSVTIPRDLGYELQLVDQTTIGQISLALMPTLLQVFVRGNPFRGRAGLTQEAKTFYQNLFETEQLAGVIIYGSPYVLEWFKSQFPKQLAWVFSYAQIPQAQAIALQKILGISAIANTKEGINWDA